MLRLSSMTSVGYWAQMQHLLRFFPVVTTVLWDPSLAVPPPAEVSRPGTPGQTTCAFPPAHSNGNA